MVYLTFYTPINKNQKSKPPSGPEVMTLNDSGDEKSEREEQEEALIALIEHRAKEVDHLRTRVTYYQSEVLLLDHYHVIKLNQLTLY